MGHPRPPASLAIWGANPAALWPPSPALLPQDVIEPLETVSVSIASTAKQSLAEVGPVADVAATLVQRVLSNPTQKATLLKAEEVGGPRRGRGREGGEKAVPQWIRQACALRGTSAHIPPRPSRASRPAVPPLPPRQKNVDGQLYYTFDFTVQGKTFTQHRVGVITLRDGRFFTCVTTS